MSSRHLSILYFIKIQAKSATRREKMMPAAEAAMPPAPPPGWPVGSGSRGSSVLHLQHNICIVPPY